MKKLETFVLAIRFCFGQRTNRKLDKYVKNNNVNNKQAPNKDNEKDISSWILARKQFHFKAYSWGKVERTKNCQGFDFSLNCLANAKRFQNSWWEKVCNVGRLGRGSGQGLIVSCVVCPSCDRTFIWGNTLSRIAHLQTHFIIKLNFDNVPATQSVPLRTKYLSSWRILRAENFCLPKLSFNENSIKNKDLPKNPTKFQ